MKKKKVVMKQLQRKRDAYLIEAQERMIVQREQEIHVLEGELRASHLWIACLLDKLIGDGEEVVLTKEEITQGNPMAFEYAEEDGMIRVRRSKQKAKTEE